jgi:uncharacterized membrane protein YozB (DUF420 family)
MLFFILTDGAMQLDESVHTTNATINLAIQVALIILLYLSINQKRKGNLAGHARLMLAALAVNLLSISIAMFPSLPQFYMEQTLSFYVSVMHGVLGGVAEILGVYLVAGWLLAGSGTPFCAGKGKQMRITMGLWAVSLLLGFLVYVLHVGFDL